MDNVFGVVKHPAQPHELSFWLSKCGALSVPKKNDELPDVAAFNNATRCLSRFATGKQ